MEYTFRVIIILVLLLIGALVFVSLIMRWSQQSGDLFNLTITPWQNLLFGG